ncbi:DsbA family protein [Noviherbaspirillum sp.]|uniref:DsbA family protein n=1 Tax=Noviherbaspirillum sp. TaxID=1926288 RepID=UPI002FE165A6
MPRLVYIADPMCSWCYGFGPELSALLAGLPDLPLDIVVGGLRAGNTQPMDAGLKAKLLSHWRQVGERSGLPFNEDALGRAGFVYDTEPACRAVVTARLLSPSTALPVFHAIQHAFYAQGLDTTQATVLARVSADAMSKAGFVIDADTFRATWDASATVADTQADFLQTQRWGVRGFPTLVLERQGELHLVSSGYMNVAGLVENMQALVDAAPAGD